jgi:hypothetical protein
MFTELLPSKRHTDTMVISEVYFYFLSCFSKVCDLLPLCVPVYPPPPISYVYHGTPDLLNGVPYKSLPSVCVSVYIYPSIVARKRLFINVTAARNSRGIVGRVVFNAVRVISKESRPLVCGKHPQILPRTSSSK